MVDDRAQRRIALPEAMFQLAVQGAAGGRAAVAGTGEPDGDHVVPHVHQVDPATVRGGEPPDRPIEELLGQRTQHRVTGPRTGIGYDVPAVGFPEGGVQRAAYPGPLVPPAAPRAEAGDHGGGFQPKLGEGPVGEQPRQRWRGRGHDADRVEQVGGDDPAQQIRFVGAALRVQGNHPSHPTKKEVTVRAR